MTPEPIQLCANLEEKIWGVTNLEPWFHSPGGKIGEALFYLPDGRPLPLLVKLLFTSDQLSVQVHPDDAYARMHEGCGGKAEMWYVLAAEPGAKLALGFRQPVTRQRAREAAISGEIERLLQWWPVSAGQVYMVPPGTVHTLGAGIVVCEVQQNNPITYRMYDYGRARDIQLEKAIEVLRFEPHPGPAHPTGELLIQSPHFVVERFEITSGRYDPDASRFHLLIAIEGAGRIGKTNFVQGQGWYVPPGAEPFDLTATAGRAAFIRAYVPS
jgi:mannose-6-phosphate isomerase